MCVYMYICTHTYNALYMSGTKKYIYYYICPITETTISMFLNIKK